MVGRQLEVVVVVDIILRGLAHMDEVTHVDDKIALLVDGATENFVEPIER